MSLSDKGFTSGFVIKLFRGLDLLWPHFGGIIITVLYVIDLGFRVFFNTDETILNAPREILRPQTPPPPPQAIIFTSQCGKVTASN